MTCRLLRGIILENKWSILSCVKKDCVTGISSQKRLLKFFDNDELMLKFITNKKILIYFLLKTLSVFKI